MAGGKLTPRQKMINLMYLIFIAMLALNVSKEVLTGYGLINKKMEETNDFAKLSNANLLDVIKTQKEEKGGEFDLAYQNASKVAQITNKFNTYIEGIKSKLTEKVEINKNTGNLNYEVMDKGDYIDENWFGPKGLKDGGIEFKNKMESYKKELKNLLAYDQSRFSDVIKSIDKRFDLSDVKNKDGKNQEYFDYHFKGFPSITSLTKLTAFQSDVKKIETDVFNALLGEAAKKASSVTKLQANIILEKNVFFSGEQVKGKVVLAKYDDNFNVKSATGGTFENGQLVISETAGSVGTRTIAGSFVFEEDGKEIPLDFKGEYVVVPRPNSATISADKMNVLYRGLDNPLTISFAGVPDTKVRASGPGMRQVKGGSYMINPPQGGNEVVIDVNATLDDGKVVNDKKKFRVKNVPPPTGFVRGEYGDIKGPASSLEKVEVTAKPLDFDFDVLYTVQSFTIKVPGQQTVVVNGSRMSPQAISVIKNAKRGDQVIISNILARMGSTSLVQKASNVVYEVQ